MKRAIFIFILSLLIVQVSHCQDSLSGKGKLWDASAFAGAGFKGYFGSAYIKPTVKSSDDPFQAHIYDGFTRKPSFFFDAGILFSLRLSGHFHLASGISYALRKSIYENSMDSVKDDFTVTTMENINNVIKFNYSFNNIEIPLFLEYSVMNTTVFAGFRASLFSFQSADYSYLIAQDPFNPNWTTSGKKICEFEMPLKFYPSVQISYRVRIGKISFDPFVAFDFFEIDLNNPTVEKSYYLQAGVLYHLPCFR
jgi:hypothetical protein